MMYEQIPEDYAMPDGEVISFFLDYSGDRTITMSLKVRKRIKKQKYESCEVMILMGKIFEIYINEDFGTNGRYSDFTFQKTGDGYYLSLDPYDNSGIPNENDNFVVRSNTFVFID